MQSVSKRQRKGPSQYFLNMVCLICESSESKVFKEAVKEWDVIGFEDLGVEEDSPRERCRCGKEDLRYVYTIQNAINANVITPVGSVCIKHFEDAKLERQLKVFAKKHKKMRVGPHSGKTFEEICEKHTKYVKDIQRYSAVYREKQHRDLIEYYEMTR